MARITPKKEFLIGSKAFFGDIEGYSSKDVDKLCIMTIFPFRGNILRMHGNSKDDIFICRDMSKEEFIEHTLKSNTPMEIGKFLVPEFANYIGLTIEDLKRLEPVIKNIDEKHKYERLIYDSYIENNSFILSEQQKIAAYEVYKKSR